MAGEIYRLEGRMLAGCSCDPCTCSACKCGSYDSFVAYHIERGKIRELDVSNVTLVKFIYNQGNAFANHWHSVVYVDARATAQQQEAILKAFNGELGGTLADLANLISEAPEVKVVPIEYGSDRKGSSLKIGNHFNDLNATSSRFCFAA